MFQEKTLPKFFTTHKKQDDVTGRRNPARPLWERVTFRGQTVTLPETNSQFTPENRQNPKRKGSYSNHPFSGTNWLASFQGGYLMVVNQLDDSQTSLKSGWWFQIFFMFTPIWGRFPFWRAYFSKGLVQPPTSKWLVQITKNPSIQNCLALGYYQVVSCPLWNRHPSGVESTNSAWRSIPASNFFIRAKTTPQFLGCGKNRPQSKIAARFGSVLAGWRLCLVSVFFFQKHF